LEVVCKFRVGFVIWEIWETGQARVSIVTSSRDARAGGLSCFRKAEGHGFAGKCYSKGVKTARSRLCRSNRHERSIVLPLTAPIAQQAAYRCKDIEGRTARESRNLGRSMGFGCLMTILFLPSRTFPAHCAQ
jgi:hypothetical protein